MHIIVDLDVGGAETMLKRLIEVNPAAIPNTAVVSLTAVGRIGELLRARGVTIHSLAMSSGWSSPIALFRLVRLIRQYQPAIVQTWMYHSDLLGGLAARIAGCRNVVWNVRRTAVSVSDLAQTALVMKLCALLSCWVPKQIVCVAEAAKEAHIAAGYCADRMVVIHNGFDLSQFDVSSQQRLMLRKAYQLVDGEVVIGMVGRFHPDKGQLNFIKAAAKLLAHRSAVKFMMVGRGCEASNDILVAWLNEYGLREHSVLLGERADVAVCLSAMDIFCMPSRTEGFPNGLGEAMAMGLACVATQVGDTSLLAGDAVVLVPPENDEALAAALLNMLDLSADQRSQIGQAAKVRLTREFSIEKAASRFKAVYQEVLTEAKT